ncbi:glycoside hydrolase [Clostridium sp. MB05]
MNRRKILNQLISTSVIFTMCLSAVPTMHAKASTNIYVNPAAQYQTMEGWGTALAWWADIVGGWSQPNKDAIMDTLYDANKGLGFNIARYNIGGGENPNHQHMRAGGEVPGFQPENGVWDWNADDRQKNILLEANKRGANILEAFSNSPPYWMTKSGCTSGKGLAPIFGVNNLQDSKYTDFADYLTEVVKYFRDYDGINFTTLSPINEPNSPAWCYNGAQEGCHWDRSNQNTIMKEVGKKIEEKNLDTILSGPEENTIDETIDSYNYYDNTAKSYISQINTHSYAGSKRYELKELAARENKNLWMSEYGCGGDWREPISSHDHSSMKWPLRLANTITSDINDMGVPSWVYWQAVEGEEGAVSGKHSWGLIHATFEGGKEEYWYTNQYYVMGNYSKFIRPGAKIINSGNNKTVAAYDENNNTLVLVVTNDTTSAQEYNFDLSAFNTLGTSANVYRTSFSEALSKVNDVNIQNKALSVTANPESVTTYVIPDVNYNGMKSINDTIVGNQQEKFNYVGNWNYKAGISAFSNDCHWTETADSYFESKFTGTQVSLYGEKNTYHGIAAISIDGGPEVKVNCYAPTRADNTLLYTSPLLESGEHTIKVRATGEKDPNSTSIVLTADRLDVYNDGLRNPINLALGKQATADSVEGRKKHYANNATDGLTNTEWIANDGYWTHWLQVDLGDIYSVDSTEINRESNGSPYKYYIETSTDGVNWAIISDKRQNMNADNIQADEFNAIQARYVRIQFTEVNGWVSLREFKIFGY